MVGSVESCDGDEGRREEVSSWFIGGLDSS